MTDGASFNILGPWQVRVGRREVEVPPGRLRTLLAVLLLSIDEPVPVDTLAERLWPEDAPVRARATVHTYIARLRRLIGSALITTAPGGGYQLLVAADSLDLNRFRHLVRQAADAACGDDELALLRQALRLWRGKPFGDAASTWLDHHVVPALTDEWFAAVERRVDLELDVEAPSGLIAELRELTDRYPTRESLWVRLITALHRAGRRTEALDAYQQIRETLIHELGIDPSEQLTRLQRAVLRDAVDDVADGNPVGPPVPAQLPAGVADFAGRARDLSMLDDVLPAVGAETTVVVLAGTAGVGKTALAVRWAHRVAAQFPDGQLFVNLRGYAPGQPVRPVEALAGFLAALGVSPERIPPEVDTAAALFRSLMAGRRMLVVLDNVADADQARPLVPGGTASLVLVTSRQLLTGLVVSHSARQHTLAPLTAQDAVELVSAILGPDRVAAEPDATHALVQECSCLPLALRIAAANVRADAHLDLAGYVAELRADRLTPLAVEGDPAASVRSAFDWSYLRLSEGVRRLFRHLGLVPGPDITAETAAVLTGTDLAAAGRALRTLTGAHLIERHTRQRYALHDLLRAYAAEQAHTVDSDPDRDAAMRRLLDWYLHGAVAATELLYPMALRLPTPPPAADTPIVAHTDRAAARDWLTAERRNLVAAVTHAATSGHHEHAWLLGDALRGYFHSTGYMVDWLTVAQATADAAVAGDDLTARAAAAANLAHAHNYAGHTDTAIDHVMMAVSLARQAGWTAGEARALNHLGVMHAETGHLEQAADLLREALELDRRIGDHASVGQRLSNLGLLCSLAGRLDEASSYLEQALDVYRRGGRIETWALINLGGVRRLLGALDAATRSLAEGLAVARELGDRRAEAFSLAALSEVHRDRGELSEAQRHAVAADAIAREIGSPMGSGYAANCRAAVEVRLGLYDSAVARYEEVLRKASQNGFVADRVTALTGLARAQRHLGLFDDATLHIDQAIKLAETCGHRIYEGEAHAAKGEIELDCLRHDGEPDALRRALAHAERALALQRQSGHRSGEAQTLLLLSRIEALLER